MLPIRVSPFMKCVALPALLTVFVLTGAVGCAGSRAADRSTPTLHNADVAPEMAAGLAGSDAPARFVEASALFLGVPYENGPLGEGAGNDPDPDPRVDFAKADCVTYLEQSLALALAPPTGGAEFLDVLDAIRYRNGVVGFVDRNHYMVTDWIPGNESLLEDVTAAVAEGLIVPITRKIDRAKFLRDQGESPRDGIDDAREVTIDVVPREAARDVVSSLRSGDLVFWVGKAETIFVVHTGLFVRDEHGEAIFRHASSKAGSVLDESFLDYAERAGFTKGFLVLRLRDEATATPTGPRLPRGDG